MSLWDGLSWAMFTVVREGNFILLYCNKTLLNTFSVSSFLTYGGTLTQFGAQVISAFAPRIFAEALSADAIGYAYDDVVENNGNATMELV